MVEAYKILKSLMKSMRRLVIHLGTDEDHSSQASSIPSIQTLLTETLTAMTSEGDLQSLIQISTKKDQHEFVSAFRNMSQIDTLRKSVKCKYIGRNMLGVRKFDDWIHALEIGNIMHLNPLTT